MIRVVALGLMVSVCLLGNAASLAAADVLTVAGLGDCEKITKDEAVPASPHFWDAATRKLTMHGGRNEMVAAQIMLTAAGADVQKVNVEIGDLKGPGTIAADPNLQLSLELYQFVSNGSWSWGGGSKMLPSKKWYPEVLAPFKDPYSSDHKAVAAPFDIKTENGKNQGVWVDLYIPKDAKPGTYAAAIQVTVDSKKVLEGTLEVKVHDFTLSDETHVDGFGEFYGNEYDMNKAPYSKGFDVWWADAKRFHQMAHQHRFVISDRVGAGPGINKMDEWFKAYTPVLNGSLFTAKEGYYGPGENTGPTFYKVPFPEVGIKHWTEPQLAGYTSQLKTFWDTVVKNGWDKKRWVAYMIDEIKITPETIADTKRLQEALDAGSDKHVALLWTSHTDPVAMAADPATDICKFIRWWSPNGAACNATFLPKRAAAGETVWFYHAGHPAIGVHGVNATGVELRTWGTICWRYKINGSFWWAMDMDEKEKPLERPLYKPGEDRWGNGILFYPGGRLSDVGLPNIEGPLSSLRMKAYRRGLQDYEYGWLLAQKGQGAVADEIVKRVIPKALTEATGVIMGAKEGGASASGENTGGAVKATPAKKEPAWSEKVDDWYKMREDMAAALAK